MEVVELVVLVDEHDNETGTMEKQQAHITASLHRAVSVFIFNSRNELLLQQRAAGKYHSALQWTNTCCSHPRPGEVAIDAAHRRLQEEMGLSCNLQKAFTFVYLADLENGLTEHEYDHVFTGITDTTPVPDEGEAAAWKYMTMDELKKSIEISPDSYTPWFKLCIDKWYNELLNTPKQ
jgi:isopentenyl-diphosphate Delta-isomerase